MCEEAAQRVPTVAAPCGAVALHRASGRRVGPERRSFDPGARLVRLAVRLLAGVWVSAARDTHIGDRVLAANCQHGHGRDREGTEDPYVSNRARGLAAEIAAT
jgi:hypothetical protein